MKHSPFKDFRDTSYSIWSDSFSVGPSAVALSVLLKMKINFLEVNNVILCVWIDVSMYSCLLQRIVLKKTIELEGLWYKIKLSKSRF